MEDNNHQIEGDGHPHDRDFAHRCFTEDSTRLFSATANEFERIQRISPPWSEHLKGGENEPKIGLIRKKLIFTITAPNFQWEKIDGNDGETVDEILIVSWAEVPSMY